MLELEKGELQHILEEAEAALEIEENKVQRVSPSTFAFLQNNKTNFMFFLFLF